MAFGTDVTYNEKTDEISFEIFNGEKVKRIKRDKGDSLLEFPDDFVVIDIETTGLSARCDEIIELSALKCVNNKIVDKFSSLVKPCGYFIDEDENGNELKYYVTDFITTLTGITNEMLETAPNIEVVLPVFLKFCGDSILVGHNVNFDVNFIYDTLLHLKNQKFENDFVDLMRICRILFPNFPNHKLKTVAKNLEIEHMPSHRAGDDCLATLECFLKCKSYAEANNIDLYASRSKYYKNHKNLDLRAVKTDKTDFDTSHPLFNKFCVFTGTLEKMSRIHAAETVVNFGGHCENSVTKKTNYLILGNFDYCRSLMKDGKTQKHKRAEELILKGQDLKIIPEDVFYDMIFDNLS